MIGFFWACVRRPVSSGENPALGLGKIKVVQIPTDYFPPEEFDRIIDATYHVCDNRGGFIDDRFESQHGSARMTLTELMRWTGLRIRDAITLESGIASVATPDQPSPLPGKDRHTRLRAAPSVRGRGPREFAGRPETESPLLLLEWQRRSQKRGRQLAEKLSSSFQAD